jgi:hypothetical protein
MYDDDFSSVDDALSLKHLCNILRMYHLSAKSLGLIPSEANSPPTFARLKRGLASASRSSSCRNAF